MTVEERIDRLENTLNDLIRGINHAIHMSCGAIKVDYLRYHVPPEIPIQRKEQAQP